MSTFSYPGGIVGILATLSEPELNDLRSRLQQQAKVKQVELAQITEALAIKAAKAPKSGDSA